MENYNIQTVDKIHTKYVNFKKIASRRLYSYLELLYYFRPRYLMCFGYGILGGLGMTPFNFIPFFIVSVFSIIRLCDFAKNAKESYFIGLWYFYGFSLIVFYWIPFSMLTDIKYYGLFPIVLLLMPFVYAIPHALMFMIYKEVSYYTNAIERVMFFASVWCIFEYIRAFTFVAFPWGLTGYAMMFSSSIFQFASVIGVYGFSVFLVFFASSVHLIFLNGDGYVYYGYLRYIFTFLIAMILMFVYGFFVLKFTKTQYQDNVMLRVVQAGIKQTGDKTADERFDILNSHKTLTTSQSMDKITHIIWPESSVEFSIYQNEWVSHYLQQMLSPNQILIAGSMRIEELSNSQNNNHIDNIKLYNTMSMLNGKGQQTYYDKHFLVPYGEFVPFRNVMPFLKSLTGDGIDYSAGKSVRVFKILNSPPFIPLICYESAFSGKLPVYTSFIKQDENGVNKVIKERAQWMIHITNDGWFGFTSGPFQHFQMSRARAIEYGMPVVRAANTGITAIIDANGRVLQKIKLNKIGIINSPLPVASKNETPFSIFGNLPALILVLLIFSFLFIHYAINKHYRKIIPLTTKVFDLLDKARGRQRDKRGD